MMESGKARNLLAVPDGYLLKEKLSMSRPAHNKLSQEEFIQKAKLKHGDKYDYSETIYENGREKIIIICHEKDENGIEHGRFLQEAGSHINFVIIGCKKCGVLHCSRQHRSTTKQFIEKAKIIHGERFDYSEVVYITAVKKVIIKCHKKDKFNIEHGSFLQTPNKHLQKHICHKCADENRRSRDWNNEKIDENLKGRFIERGENYSGQNEKSMWWKCTKPKPSGELCDHKWKTSTGAVVGKRQSGCPKCNISKGVSRILKWLDENNFIYEIEYKFVDCKNINKLPFDVALFKNEQLLCLLEYDGIQHFDIAAFAQIHRKSIDETKTKFESLKFRDNIKTQYCLDNNIELIRIPYWDYDKIEEILTRKLAINF